MKRNAFAALYRLRVVIPTSAHLHHESFTEIILRKCVPLDCRSSSCLLHRNLYSTGFTSVHGETPSAEYARMRRESLEHKFGHALGTYSSKSFNAIYGFGPFLALYRAAIISFHVLRLMMWRLFVQDMKKRAIKFSKRHIDPSLEVKLGEWRPYLTTFYAV
ncbi:hypothetical protein CR513_02917, partial [Mucuna pruriens]